MAAKRRRTKGILSGLGKVPKGKPKKKKGSPLRRILAWVGGGVLGVVILVLFIGTGARLVRSTFGERVRVQDTEVETIEQDTSALPEDQAEDVVAAAVVTLVRQEVRLPLTLEDLETVEVGTRVRVVFHYSSLAEEIEVLEWEVREEEDTEGEDPLTPVGDAPPLREE